MDKVRDFGNKVVNLRSSQCPKLLVPKQAGDQYVEDDNDDEEEDNGNECDDDDDDDESDDENEDGDENKQKGESKRIEGFDFGRHRKKRKLKSLLSSYEFAPRVAAPPVSDPRTSNPSFGVRNSLSDWTEEVTFVLLDAWGERFLKHGRKSLRFEEWQEVAEKVNQNSIIKRTDSQCRNRLDTLKKKYKKEKAKLGDSRGVTGRWVYFSKMDMLMSPKQNSGEYVFANPKVSLNHANGLEEMRDRLLHSGSGDDSDGPKRVKVGRERDGGVSIRLLADSIHKFSVIYEKMENRKSQQMLELEKMRMDFHRDLEMQKRKILERAHVEIAKIRQGDDDDDENENDLSAENVSE